MPKSTFTGGQSPVPPVAPSLSPAPNAVGLLGPGAGGVTRGSLHPSGSGDRSVDSDSELEDNGEPPAGSGPRTQLTKQESETSTDEAQFCDDASEGQRSRTCSTGQSDTEGSAPRCRSPPGEEQSDLEEYPESSLEPAQADCDTASTPAAAPAVGCQAPAQP